MANAKSVCVVVLFLLFGLIASQSEGDVRLVNGTSPSTSGRLEVLLEGDWGTVCLNGFSTGAAQAICRQLGYYDYKQFDTVDALNVTKAPNSTQILLDSVDCPYKGEDEGLLHILRCSYSRLIPRNCTHDTDVALECSSVRLDSHPYDTAVRLVSSNTGFQSEGILEVYLNNQWGSVCGDEVYQKSSDTACQQLGYTNASTYQSTYNGPVGADPIWLRDIDCGISGSHECLILCFHYPSRPVTDCPDDLVIRITCTFDISHTKSNTAGSDAVCTSYIALFYNLVAIVVGVMVAAFALCLCATLLPIFICCCCIPTSFLYQMRTRRTYHEIN